MHHLILDSSCKNSRISRLLRNKHTKPVVLVDVIASLLVIYDSIAITQGWNIVDKNTIINEKIISKNTEDTSLLDQISGNTTRYVICTTRKCYTVSHHTYASNTIGKNLAVNKTSYKDNHTVYTPHQP